MYSMKANSNAWLCYKIHVQIHGTTESIVNIVIQSNLDYPDLDYPDYSIIRTFFSGHNFFMNIN